MGKWSTKITALLASILLVGGAAEAAGAADPSGVMAENAALWRGGDGYFARGSAYGGQFAVTDLDGNGRQELFFVQGSEAVMEMLRGAAADGACAAVWDVRAYEVSRDGKRLELLPLGV